MARSPFSILVSTLAVQACLSTLPAPPRTAHPAAAFIEVAYPPPAALVEVVPDPPPSDGIWVDGHWVWRGRHYVWRRGGWVRLPEDAAYATWQTVLAKDGRLLFAPGAWYDLKGRALPSPEMLVVARTPPNQTTLETEAAR